MTNPSKITPPTTRTMASEAKKRTTNKSFKTNSIVEQLRQQAPSPHSKRRRNEENSLPLSQRSLPSSTDASEVAPMDFELEFDKDPVPMYQTTTTTTLEKDDDSAATDNMDNITKDLFCTRMDIRINVPPHTNPEEKRSKFSKNF